MSTTDRLGGRWNRFSWFGLQDVREDGSLSSSPLKTDLGSLIATLEAVLIETLKPPQNRKRGDGLAGSNTCKKRTPELQERELKNMLRSVETRLRAGF